MALRKKTTKTLSDQAIHHAEVQEARGRAAEDRYAKASQQMIAAEITLEDAAVKTEALARIEQIAKEVGL